jgi:hypothetical protein
MNSSELRSFLTGLILGDGSIDKGVDRRAFRIKSINFDFIDYIERELSNNTNFQITVDLHEASIIDGVNRKAYKELKVKSHPYFNKKYNHFYDDYRGRRVTSEALSWITPIALANWYMSDGYIVLVGKTSGVIKDRRVEIATDRYPLQEVEKMKEYLEATYGFKIILVKHKDNHYRLRFSLLSAQYLFLMIAPYIVPSMRYKIILPYENRPKWMCDEYYNLITRLQSAERLTGNAEDEDIV